jgi:PAS domain S-box-containing protein
MSRFVRMLEYDLKQLFGRRLKSLRQALNLTQSQLAELSGISEEYLSKLERGLASPSFNVLAELSRTLDIRPMELFRFSLDNDLELGDALAEADSILRGVFDTMPFGVFISTESGRFRLASPSMARMLGYDSSSDMMRNITDMARDLYTEPSERKRIIGSLPLDGSTRVFMTNFRNKAGKSLPVRMNLRRVAEEDNQDFFVGIIEDIGLKGMEAEHHEWLAPLSVRELHHRLKNNFAMIKSYLDLAMRDDGTESCHGVLSSASRKVMAVSKLHENLYRSTDLRFVDVSKYLSDLVSPLQEGFATERGIHLHLDCPSCHIDSDRALPVGIITTELMTNALKHAFPENRSGQVHLSFKRQDQDYEIHIRDNGIGLNHADILEPDDGNLGMSLVRSMIKRLDGRLKIDPAPQGAGASIRVVFPA